MLVRGSSRCKVPWWGFGRIGAGRSFGAKISCSTRSLRGRQLFFGTIVPWITVLAVLVICSSCALTVGPWSAGLEFIRSCNTECAGRAGFSSYSVSWGSCVGPSITDITSITLGPGDGQTLCITVPIVGKGYIVLLQNNK